MYTLFKGMPYAVFLAIVAAFCGYKSLNVYFAEGGAREYIKHCCEKLIQRHIEFLCVLCQGIPYAAFIAIWAGFRG